MSEVRQDIGGSVILGEDEEQGGEAIGLRDNGGRVLLNISASKLSTTLKLAEAYSYGLDSSLW
jgi:hypothetical protein